MRPYHHMLMILSVLLLAGCSSSRKDRVFLDRAPIVVDRPDGSQELILFPQYFLMEGYTLNDHGHIPNTRLIGAGFTADLDLATVRTQFSDLLHGYQWTTDRVEIGSQYFRILASHNDETVEIRAVQGISGATQIFLLYTPSFEG